MIARVTRAPRSGEPLADTVADAANCAISLVHHLVEVVFTVLEDVREATARCLAGAPPGERSRPAVADLAPLRPLLWERLGDAGGAVPPGLIAGIGFIAAPGLLADAPWYLEWWQENPSGPPVRLLRDLDPSSSAFYDYTHWGWYTGPRDGAARTVFGPYVDYLCTEEYSLTFSVPVTVDGRFAGAAAADVLVRRFEAAVLPALREIAAPAFLVNAEGRVAASNTASWTAGSVYRGTEGFAVRQVADLPLFLVTAG